MKHEPKGREERETAREGTQEPKNQNSQGGTQEPKNRKSIANRRQDNTPRVRAEGVTAETTAMLSARTNVEATSWNEKENYEKVGVRATRGETRGSTTRGEERNTVLQVRKQRQVEQQQREV